MENQDKKAAEMPDSVQKIYEENIEYNKGMVMEIRPLQEGFMPDQRIVKMKAKAKELGLQPQYPLSPEDWLRYFETET